MISDSASGLYSNVLSEQDAGKVILPLADGGILRPLRTEAVTDAYVDGLNNPLVNRHLTEVRRQPQTRASVEAYVNANWESATDTLFGLFIEGGLRGTVRLHDVQTNPIEQAWIGIAIFDTSCWGQGWGCMAISAVVSFGLKTMGLKRINAGIYTVNQSSRGAFARTGFKLTGSLPGDENGPAELWTIERDMS